MPYGPSKPPGDIKPASPSVLDLQSPELRELSAVLSHQIYDGSRKQIETPLPPDNHFTGVYEQRGYPAQPSKLELRVQILS